MSPYSSDPEVVARVTGAVKTYGRQRALDGLELELRRGQWTGMIGPNGAGKTTSMLAIAGLIPLDAGTVEVVGERVTGPRPDRVGWVPQEIALYGHLTGRENLEAFGALHGLSGRELRDQVAWALDWTGLGVRAEDRVATYSGGMQRRLNIACAVLHRPQVLLLDEPTVGVDPQARLRTFAMLQGLRDEGVTLLHSSHELGDIETRCDSLHMIDQGRSIASGTVQELVREVVGGQAVATFEIGGLEHQIAGLERQPGGTWTAHLDDPAVELPGLLSAIQTGGGQIEGLDLHRPGLREAFLQLTGRELRE